MKKHFWFFFVLAVVSVVLGIAVQAIGSSKGDPGSVRDVSFLVSIVAGVIGVFVRIIWLEAQLIVVDGKKPTYALVLSSVSSGMLYLKLLGTYLITQLILVVGFVLLIIPGIFFAVRLQFVYYAVVDKGMGPFKALGYSWEITRGHWWDLLLFNIASLGVNLLGFLALLVGLFASVPTTRIAHTHVYRELSK